MKITPVRNLKQKLNEYRALIALVLIIIAVHYEWFFNLGIKTNGDWVFYFKSTMTSLRLHYFTVWLSDYSFGRVLSDSGQAPTYAAYGFLADFFNANYALAERIVHLWPATILAPITSYFLVYHLFKDKTAAIVGAVVYSLNTYFLTLQTGDITLTGAYIFMPLVVLMFMKLNEKQNVKYVILSGLSLTACSAYEPRGAYIAFGILFLYTATIVLSQFFRKELKLAFKSSLYFISPVILFLFLNLYWILGLSHANNVGATSGLSNGLFGTEFFDLRHAITLMQPYWNFKAPIAFIVNSIPVYFWVIPIMAFAGFYSARRNFNVIFFAVIGLIGILLTKQTGAPFTHLYSWLFYNVPGFNAFRESSKFYFMIALAYSVLIPAFYIYSKDMLKAKFKNKKALAYIIPFFITILPFVPNTIPLITDSIGTTFTTRQVPPDYEIFNNFVIRQTGYFRIYWMPKDSRFSLDTADHPRIDSPTIIDSAWKDYFPNSDSEPSVLANKAVVESPFSNSLMDISSIKYVVVPTEDTSEDDNLFNDVGHTRDEYIDALNNANYLKKINIGTKSLLVYQNEDYKPYVTTSSLVKAIPSYDNFEKYYDFSTSALNDSAFNFVAQSEVNKTSIPQTDIYDPMESLSNKSLNKNNYTITSNLNTALSNTLYINQNATDYKFSIINNQMTFTKVVDNSLSINNVSGKIIDTSQNYNLPSANYLLTVGDQVIGLDKQLSQSHDLGVTQDAIQLFSYSNNNLIGSLRPSSGEFQCSQSNNTISHGYLNPSYVAIMVNRLNLNCVKSSLIPVNNLNYLEISYDYSIDQGQRAGYQLKFNDPAHTTYDGSQTNSDNSYHSFSAKVSVPKDATGVTLRLYGYPDDHNQKTTTNSYRNINIKSLNLEQNLVVNQDPKFEKVNLNNIEKVVFKYINTTTVSNLISNGSFESGLWQKKVGDCDNYDNKPLIGMSLSKDATSGKASLQLNATRHTACTTPNSINVNEGSDYDINFDYKNVAGNATGYSVTFNDQSRSRIDKRLNPNNNSWQHLNQIVRVPYGATSMVLTVYAYADETDETTGISRYDNFSVLKVPSLSNKYFLVSSSKMQTGKVNKVTSVSESSTKKVINLEGASGTFIVNMSEAYNSNWTLTEATNRNKFFPDLVTSSIDKAAISNSIESNDFMNSWYVNISQLCHDKQNICKKNPDGTYDVKLVVVFRAQNYFQIGLDISVATLIISIISLTIIRIRAKWHGYPLE
jgi:hypothetical protein